MTTISPTQASQLFWCFLLAIFFGVGNVSADEAPCTAHANNQYFDLNPLKSSTDYKLSSLGNREYFINVCRPVATETWATKVDKPENIAGFTRRDHGDFSLGSVNTTLEVLDGHPALTLTGGSACAGAGDLYASTVIRFVCDPSVSDTGRPQLIAQLPPADDSACAFFIEWRTRVACPTREKGSWGFMSVVGTLVGILAMLYVVCGVFYNYSVLQLRGMDLIPWCSTALESLEDGVRHVRDWVDQMRAGSGGGSSRSGGVGYRGIASDHEEGTSMLGGPLGYLYEQDEDEEDNVGGQGVHNGSGKGAVRL